MKQIGWGVILALAWAFSASAGCEPVLELAHVLAAQNLPYKFGATKPEEGGLDCSGYVQWVFKKAYGIKLPDEAGLQLEFLRKNGKVWDAKTGWKPADLKPGDLIFWTGTYPIHRRSPVTHVMVYQGNGIMAGAQSAGRRLNAHGSGVGLYNFSPHSPKGGSMPDDKFFNGQIHLYAYGRLAVDKAAPVLAKK